MLEFAVLGLLAESPLHGYELRKRLNSMLGTLRAFSYGSLYPTLRRMQARGWVTADNDSGRSGRSKVVYSLTAEGKERFAELLDEAGPSAWEDETFSVHFSFFAQTDPELKHRGLAAFLVDTEHPGFSSQEIHGKMGLHGSDTASLALDDGLVDLAGGEVALPA